jgi:hypothetical protein
MRSGCRPLASLWVIPVRAGRIATPSGPLASSTASWFLEADRLPWGTGSGATLPFYYSLASVFPIADRYFCSLLGPTFPNRRYLMAATSMGMINDTVPGPTDYPQNGTIFDRLHGAGVSWKDYFSLASIASQLALFPPLLVKYAGNLQPVSEFFEDAQAGNLPGFSLVEPNYGLDSEESPQNIALGERFAAQVINAVMNGPGWESSLLIWGYDEHGATTITSTRRALSLPTTSRPTPTGATHTADSPATASACHASWCRRGRGRTTSLTMSSITPASAPWSRPNGTWQP